MIRIPEVWRARRMGVKKDLKIYCAHYPQKGLRRAIAYIHHVGTSERNYNITLYDTGWALVLHLAPGDRRHEKEFEQHRVCTQQANPEVSEAVLENTIMR